MNTTSQNNFINSLKHGIGSVTKKTGTTFSLVIVYIVICAVFAILSPYFLTVKNFLNIGTYTSIIGVMGAGVTIAMLLGAIDISQYSVATLSSLVAALMLKNEYPIILAVLGSLVIGVVCGAVNGALVAFLRIPAIIATLGTMQVFRGLAYLSTGGLTVMVGNKKFGFLGKGYLFNAIPVSLVVMILVFLIVFYILKHTVYGKKIYAVGGNESASYLSGIRVTNVKFGALIICSITSAVSGLILASQVGAAIPTTGVGMEMGVLSAVILGGISLSGGKGKISGTIIGVLILATIQNGLTMLSVQSYYQMIINGLVLIIAVLLDIFRSGVLRKK